MDEYLKLKKANCKNCYKCIRNCPVKSISFSNDQANIIGEDCILCGHCFVACPQNAKEIRNDIDKAKALVCSNHPVYASIAPSFIANYDHVTITSMKKSLLQLGFEDVEETAAGASMVKKRYEEITGSGKQDVIVTTCCHTVNLLVQKYFPDALPYLAAVVSPMQAHCRDIKRRVPDARTVFIGPCISKKAEAEGCSDDVDCVLTFEELSEWLDEKKITFEYIEDSIQESHARLFPVAGGILQTMTEKNPDFTYLAVDGMESCIQALKDIVNGNLKKCFIEMSACAGSCVGGPAMDQNRRAPVRDYVSVKRYAGAKDFALEKDTVKAWDKKFESLAPRKVILSDSAIEKVLKEIGKTKPEHELNCGTCGYDTCREKAMAVINGKANLAMCLPYLKEKAESFSDAIITNSPNAIIVVNENYDVQLINKAACQLIHITSPGEILGDQVVRILEPMPFIEACQKGKNIYEKRTYLAEYRKYVDQTVLYEKEYHIIICIMRDVTEETNQRTNRQELNRKTVEITDKVIEKQMRVVQEIASLLGETAAETKVALTKLKESLHDE